MPYSSKEKYNAYKRRRYHKRKDEFFKGKICVWCGAVDNLQLDHIDRRTKEFEIKWNWPDAKLEVELAKCQILCEDCHNEKTAIEREPDHGTISRYTNWKCRCNPCKDAWKLYMRGHRANGDK